jgi:hypothetical protein
MRCPIEPLAEALAYAPRPWFSSTLVPIFSAFMTHLAIMAGYSWTPHQEKSRLQKKGIPKFYISATLRLRWANFRLIFGYRPLL